MSGFAILPSSNNGNEARLGRLELPGRNAIDTPHYVAISSRGTVPHITQDLMRSDTSIQGIYAGLEDYVEHLPKPPPVYSVPSPNDPDSSRLRRFIALHQSPLIILGPRRIPPLSTPVPNTYTSLSISTSLGFRQLEIIEYIKAVTLLEPDVAVGPADVELGDGRPTPGTKRKEKMVERTLAWMRALEREAEAESKDEVEGMSGAKGRIWVPILPVEPEMQRSYREHLVEKGEERRYAGVVLYDDSSVIDIPPLLQTLPRLSLCDIKTPHAALRAISLGLDFFTLPFLASATDAGIAFTFSFPTPSNSHPSLSPSTASREPSSTNKSPLGIDLWSNDFKTDASPLKPGCACYTCSHHHRAYIRHLLDAKEMLAWTLLALHNYTTVDAFFASVRRSIANSTFEDDVKAFVRWYEEDMPGAGEAGEGGKGLGRGPRMRGYQVRRTEAGLGKIKEKARKKLVAAEVARDLEKITVNEGKRGEGRGEKEAKVDDGAQKMQEAIEAEVFAPELGAETMEGVGFAEKERAVAED